MSHFQVGHVEGKPSKSGSFPVNYVMKLGEWFFWKLPPRKTSDHMVFHLKSAHLCQCGTVCAAVKWVHGWIIATHCSSDCLAHQSRHFRDIKLLCGAGKRRLGFEAALSKHVYKLIKVTGSFQCGKMADDYQSTKKGNKCSTFPDTSYQVTKFHCLMDICCWDADEGRPESEAQSSPTDFQPSWKRDGEQRKGKTEVLCFLSLTGGSSTLLSAESAFSHFKTSPVWFKLSVWTRSILHSHGVTCSTRLQEDFTWTAHSMSSRLSWSNWLNLEVVTAV